MFPGPYIKFPKNFAIFLSTDFVVIYLLNFGTLILLEDACCLFGVLVLTGPQVETFATHKPFISPILPSPLVFILRHFSPILSDSSSSHARWRRRRVGQGPHHGAAPLAARLRRAATLSARLHPRRTALCLLALGGWDGAFGGCCAVLR